MVDLDQLDKKILYELDLDARIPASKLAKKLKKSKETVNFRINRLLKEGFLKGFYTVFNTSKLGFYYIKSYIKLKGITPAQEEEIISYLRKQEHVAYLANTEGNYDLVLLLMVRSAKEFTDFLYSFLKLYGEFIQEKDIMTFLTTHHLNQKFFTPGGEFKDLFYPVELGNYTLDETDRKIFRKLSNNARIPLTEIAKELRCDPKLVKYRLNKLEKDKIILGYVSSPNFDKLSLQFIQVNISLKDPTSIKEIIRYFDSTNKCLFAMEMIGKYDLAVEIHVESNEELKKIMDKFRELFNGKYTNYDILTITKEQLVVWAPF